MASKSILCLPDEIIVPITEYLKKCDFVSLRLVSRWFAYVIDGIIWRHLNLQPSRIPSLVPRLFLSYSNFDHCWKKMNIFFNLSSVNYLHDFVRLSCFQHVRNLCIWDMPNDFIDAFLNVSILYGLLENLVSLTVTLSTNSNSERLFQQLNPLFIMNRQLRLRIDLKTKYNSVEKMVEPILSHGGIMIDRVDKLCIDTMYPEPDESSYNWVNKLVVGCKNLKSVEWSSAEIFPTDIMMKRILGVDTNNKKNTTLRQLHIRSSIYIGLRWIPTSIDTLTTTAPILKTSYDENVFRNIETLYFNFIRYPQDNIPNDLCTPIFKSLKYLKITSLRSASSVDKFISGCSVSLVQLMVTDHATGANAHLHLTSHYKLEEMETECMPGTLTGVIKRMMNRTIFFPNLKSLYYGCGNGLEEYPDTPKSFILPYLRACPQLEKLYLPGVEPNVTAHKACRENNINLFDSILYRPDFPLELSASE